jgi:hypothetical protein
MNDRSERASQSISNLRTKSKSLNAASFWPDLVHQLISYFAVNLLAPYSLIFKQARFTIRAFASTPS